MENLFECPHCGQHYEIEKQYLGTRVICSVCNNEFNVNNGSRVRETNTGIYVCPHCEQHIEIEKDHLGEEVTCPTCKNTFTVCNVLLLRTKDGGYAENFTSSNKIKEATIDDKLNNLGNCGLGLSVFTLLIDPIFGIAAIIFSIQALNFVKVKDYNRAESMTATSTLISIIGIILGFIGLLIILSQS